MSRIYWDTMLFIYWLEDNPEFAKRVNTIRRRMQERNDQLLTGALTFGEVLAGVYRRGVAARANDTKRLLQGVVSEIVPFTLETADRYAHIRGALGLPAADSIHLASAALARTDLFITNDRKLVGKVIPGIQFVVGLDSNLF
ncbi:MAG: PIN domain-containing protein [Candidatus Sulfotelmatobacter sp.]